jgi:two-component system sporulation sensor kinase A
MREHILLYNALSASGTHQSLFQFHPDAIFVIGPDMIFYDCNPMTESILGYSREELTGISCSALVVPRDLETTGYHFRQALDGASQTYEIEVYHKSGAIKDISVTNVPFIVEGQVVGVYGIAKDITEGNRTRDLLRLSRNELLKLQDAFHLMAENMSDLLSITDKNGILEYVSPSYSKLLGLTHEECVGREAYLLIHAEDRQTLDDYYKHETNRRKEMQKEIRIRNKSGDYVLLECRAVPILSATGEVQNYLIVSRDIRDRKKTEELLLKTEKLSIAGQLAAGIAHEIRNPLTAIKGFIQLLQRAGGSDGRYLAIISSELERIESILTELLMLAKPQAVQFERKNLASLLGDVITLSDTQAIMMNIRITPEVEPDLPPIECVENQIKQIFFNFIKNAIDAMQKGGRIVISANRHSEAMISIRFIDEGTGIPEDLIPKLGEPFYTTKEKGTGLGLMVSQKIVEQHHGCLRFESVVGKGTTVSVLLPISQPS